MIATNLHFVTLCLVFLLIVSIIIQSVGYDLSSIFGSSVALTIGQKQWYRVVTSTLVGSNVTKVLLIAEGTNQSEKMVGSSAVIVLMILTTLLTNFTQLLVCKIGWTVTADESYLWRTSVGCSHVVLAMFVVITYHMPKHLQPVMSIQVHSNQVTNLLMWQQRGFLAGRICAVMISWALLIHTIQQWEESNVLVCRLTSFGYVPIVESRLMKTREQGSEQVV